MLYIDGLSFPLRTMGSDARIIPASREMIQREFKMDGQMVVW